MNVNNQLFLISVVSVMTVLMTLVGVQLILVLRDLRRLLSTANKITAEMEKIGTSVGHGYSELVGFVTAIKKIIYVADVLSKKKKEKHAKK